MPFTKDILIEEENTNIIVSNELKFIQIVFESDQLDGIISLDKETVIKLANALLKQSKSLTK